VALDPEIDKLTAATADHPDAVALQFRQRGVPRFSVHAGEAEAWLPLI
jgi:hypothetical protein